MLVLVLIVVVKLVNGGGVTVVRGLVMVELAEELFEMLTVDDLVALFVVEVE